MEDATKQDELHSASRPSESQHGELQHSESHEIQNDDAKPYGAVFVTVVLALIILVTWFSMYALHIFRS